MFTSWYGQASCTAGRASFMTGCIPIRYGAVGRGRSRRRERPPGGDADHRRILPEERLSRRTSPANGISATCRSSIPIEHGFDEMKHFAAYYPGVYAYEDTAQ